MQRHTVELLADVAPLVQFLDAPVPQMGEQLMDALRLLDSPMAEQVVAVPKISCPSHAGRTALREPQRVEQLVEVPTLLTYSFIQQRTAEQNVDIPVPSPRPRGVQIPARRTVEQSVDIPVPRTGAVGGHQGFSGQGSAHVLVEVFTVFTRNRLFSAF